MIKTRSIAKVVASCLLGMVLGFVLIVLPRLLLAEYPGSLLKLVHSSVEGLSIDHLLFLFVGGLFFGLVFELPYAFWSSVSMLGSLPLFALVEMVKDPTSHNLWPIEFLIYAVLSVLPLAGMKFGLFMKRRFRARQLSQPSPTAGRQ